MKVSVIVSTYNQPRALALVLDSLKKQTVPDFEIVVADDGSTDETRVLIEKKRKELFGDRLIHAWQPDLGFRLAASRNNAIKKSSGKYLIFLDGDCLAFPNYVSNHVRLAEKGYFVTGNRILLSADLTRQILDHSYDILSTSLRNWVLLTIQKKMNRFYSLLSIPVLNSCRKLSPTNWKKLRGCNFAVWRSDIEKINGFDEDFVGWGFEDSDIAVRLINAGIKRKSGKFGTAVLHLYHVEKKIACQGKSWNTVMRRLKAGETMAIRGLAQESQLSTLRE